MASTKSISIDVSDQDILAADPVNPKLLCLLTFIGVAVGSFDLYVAVTYDLPIIVFSASLFIGAMGLAIISLIAKFNVIIPANIILTGIFLHIFIAVTSTGGLYSDQLVTITLIPAISTLITRGRSSVFWIVMSVVFIIFSVIQNKTLLIAYSQLPLELDYFIKSRAYASSVIVVGIVSVMAYYSKLNALKKSIGEQKKSELLMVSVENNAKELTGIMEEIKQNANILTLSSVEMDETVASMSGKVTEISEGSSLQASATSNVGETAEEMAKNIVEAVESISSIKSQTSEANTLASESSIAMDNTQASMKRIESNNESIENVTQLITDIASQTNLLALNAAIESARAGEAGRGFAVVADEVRSLSHKSTEFADKIRDLLMTSSQDIEAGSSDVQKVSQIILQITSVVSDVNNRIEDFSEQTRANGVAISALKEDVLNISQTSKTNDDAIHIIEKDMNRVKETADKLSGIVDSLTNIIS